MKNKMVYRNIIDTLEKGDANKGFKIGVAVLDTGIYKHIDFENRIVAFYDTKENLRMMYDDNGHGTHVAGIIGSSGATSNGKMRGIAPKANLISVKILDNKGKGNINNVYEAAIWLRKNKSRYNIKVANFSIGAPVYESQSDISLLKEAINIISDEGIIVVAAAGNNGPKDGTVTLPGMYENVITVGSFDDDIPIYIDEKKSKIIGYSGRGVKFEKKFKPDIMAPGYNILSCQNNKYGYVYKSGTSMSTPIISGLIALYIEKFGDCSVEKVRNELCYTAFDYNKPRNVQGCGLVDVAKFLKL